jgi:hypothetical protein
MSRKTKLSADRRFEIAYGHDRACGWFVQVWDKAIPESQNPYDTPMVNLDETQTTKGECNAAIIKVVGETYGVEITNNDLEELQAKSPRGDSPFQGILDQLEAQLGNPPKGDA